MRVRASRPRWNPNSTSRDQARRRREGERRTLGLWDLLVDSQSPYRRRCGLGWDPESCPIKLLSGGERPVHFSEFGLSEEELESVLDDWEEKLISLTLERFIALGVGELVVQFRYGPPDLV